MTKSTWKETDRFYVRTDTGSKYIIIEETAFSKIEVPHDTAVVRNEKRYRTHDGFMAHKYGEGFLFNTFLGTMIAERLLVHSGED